MSEYKVSDYGIFEDAINTTDKINTDMSSGKEGIIGLQKIISDESVFNGPIANNCNEEISSVLSKMDGASEDFKSISSYLREVSANYQEGDKAADSTVTAVQTPSTGNTVNTSIYNSNPAAGFVVTNNNNTYDLNSSDKDFLCGIVASESDQTYDDALAVISVILNRCESQAWINSFGTNPVGQAKGSGQFEVYATGAYKNYTNGRAPETVVRAVNDALAGVRNNEYLSFRSNGSTGYSSNMITNTGNRYK